ncbi:MLP-like protein 31 isoform X2 [Pyrus x bretschneideri]|uniref:MLP-like protein 31 isoform X2 n=1 Tax=Pyrus x bretschneideri TaxID=225117 RepID=UPI00202F75A3|nr:MLP-like protein 31 isoform X2 [Pyrus x bretschneideri]
MSSDCGKVEADVEIKASAAKFHEMFTHKPHHISNASNRNIQGCDLHEGDWGTVGSVVYWNYFHDGKAKVAKDLVEAIDAENNMITFKVIEGDLLEHYKSLSSPSTQLRMARDATCAGLWSMRSTMTILMLTLQAPTHNKHRRLTASLYMVCD